MSYFHLGEEAHVEKEIVYHSIALDYPHIDCETILSTAHMAKAMDPDAYFRAFDGHIYVHWTTEREVATA